MMATPLDLTGTRHGNLVVLSRAPEKRGGRVCWICQCDCGGEPVVVRGDNLKSGRTKSCDCGTSRVAKLKAIGHAKAKPVMLYGKSVTTHQLSAMTGIGVSMVRKALRRGTLPEDVLKLKPIVPVERVLDMVRAGNAPVSQPVLAAKLGMRKDAVRKAVAKLQRDGKLEVDNGMVTLKEGG